MSCSAKMTKIQIKLGRCALKSMAAPTQYSFILKKDRVISSHSPWKQPTENKINFSQFLRIKVDGYHQNQKCSLCLYSRNEKQQILLGQALISLSQNICGKVRKYPIKNSGQIVATVDASLYLFYFDHSLPLIQKQLNEISQKNHYSADHIEQFLEKHLKIYEQTYQKGNVNIKNNIIIKNLSINKQISLSVKQDNENLNVAQNLMVKLFQQIGKKNEQIQKRDAELNEKDSLFEHIKVKQMLIQKDAKKINKLKNEARLILTENQELIHHDDKYDEQFYLMKQQKQQMQSQMAIINSQASLKLMCLKAQLQNTNKQINRKQSKIKCIIDQIQNSTKILNTLKHQNKEKTKIIEFLKSQFKNPSARKEKQQISAAGNINIFELLTQQFDSRKCFAEENIETLPSDMIQERKQGNFCSLRRCKTLSIAKPFNSKQEKPPSKQRFRGNKADDEGKKMPIPNIIENIMNLGANIRCKA